MAAGATPQSGGLLGLGNLSGADWATILAGTLGPLRIGDVSPFSGGQGWGVRPFSFLGPAALVMGKREEEEQQKAQKAALMNTPAMQAFFKDLPPETMKAAEQLPYQNFVKFFQQTLQEDRARQLKQQDWQQLQQFLTGQAPTLGETPSRGPIPTAKAKEAPWSVPEYETDPTKYTGRAKLNYLQGLGTARTPEQTQELMALAREAAQAPAQDIPVAPRAEMPGITQQMVPTGTSLSFETPFGLTVTKTGQKTHESQKEKLQADKEVAQELVKEGLFDNFQQAFAAVTGKKYVSDEERDAIVAAQEALARQRGIVKVGPGGTALDIGGEGPPSVAYQAPAKATRPFKRTLSDRVVEAYDRAEKGTATEQDKAIIKRYEQGTPMKEGVTITERTTPLGEERGVTKRMTKEEARQVESADRKASAVMKKAEAQSMGGLFGKTVDKDKVRQTIQQLIDVSRSEGDTVTAEALERALEKYK